MFETRASKPTICAECRRSLFQAGWGGESWMCLRDPEVETPERFDYKSGKLIPASYRNPHVSDCRKNNGNCPHFTPRITWWRTLIAWIANKEPKGV